MRVYIPVQTFNRLLNEIVVLFHSALRSALSCHVLPCPIPFYSVDRPILPYPVYSYPITYYPNLPCRRLPHPALTYPPHTTVTVKQFHRWQGHNYTVGALHFCCEVMSRDMTKPTKWVCAQRRLRSAWASALSDQSLHCSHEESFGPELPIKRTAKTDQTERVPRLILVLARRTRVLFVLSCRGSNHDDCW